MKFLGIRNGHDCNIAYSDGTKVKYAKKLFDTTELDAVVIGDEIGVR